MQINIYWKESKAFLKTKQVSSTTLWLKEKNHTV